MKFLMLTAALLLSLNAMACDGGHGKGKDEEKGKETDERITSIR